MPSERLTLALEQMGPGDWLEFERFAAEFNAVEFPSLRTTAAFAGDKGRDGQLFKGEEDPTTVFQYSVTESWRPKIRGTLKTLRENFPNISRIVYCTNQSIGPAADDLVEEFRKDKVALDVRDRSWFAERELTHAQRETASHELAERYVRPLLAARGIASRVATPLASDDARIALLHLTLEGYDQGSNRNLTKTCFESLVLSALHGTTATATVAASDILAAVRELVPGGDAKQVAEQVAGALQRLSVRNGPVKQVGKTESFHLSFDEQQEIERRSVEFLLQSSQLNAELRELVAVVRPDLNDEALHAATVELRTCIEMTLSARSEAFATTVVSGDIRHLTFDDVRSVVSGPQLQHLSPDQAAALTLESLEAPKVAVAKYLRTLADGYTLFAFLRQTPDVQKVVLEVFQEGDLWLDTSAILPLIIETLFDFPEDQFFTNTFRAARDAGLRLYVTPGIIEEVERHLHRSLSFARTETVSWNGRVPFVYAAYALTGRARGSFASWLEEFRGEEVPEEDIQQYLSEEFGIVVESLKDLADAADPELRAAVQEIWHEVHDRRRGNGGAEITPAVTLRLVSHDVENCVGVIEKRRGSPMGPMGYRVWWLTLDSTAYRLGEKLRERLGNDAPRSPALSPDFLVELLRLGPLRSALEREAHVSLPVMADIGRYENLPIELIELADSVRKGNAHLTERVVARRVRDAVNEAKWRVSDDGEARHATTRVAIEQRLKTQAARAD